LNISVVENLFHTYLIFLTDFIFRRCDEDITVHVLGSIGSCMHASESVDDVHVERRRDRSIGFISVGITKRCGKAPRSKYMDIWCDKKKVIQFNSFVFVSSVDLLTPDWKYAFHVDTNFIY
ncbi:hypothetical protein BpHYR1_010829, partial [Brachionus plicatilis]